METYCKKDLLEAGWTEGAITRFLPAPKIETRRFAYRRGSYDVYLWPKAIVDDIRQQPDVEHYLDRVRQRNEKRQQREAEALPLLDAIREVSRAAHRWRDAASAQYEAGNYGLATHSSQRKRRLYELKERGITEAYEQGLLRYAGQTAQKLAVYEYGEGGMSCFHSCLHPVGVERPLVAEQPETLFVTAKKQAQRISDAETTLRDLPVPGEQFEQSSPPSLKKSSVSVTCWECGGSGHVARNCPERFMDEIDHVEAI
jgi:hypothetical protein